MTMADLWKDVNESVKKAGGSWAGYTALGTFALYVLGYLSLRFRLTALGIGTDLTVLDERYAFEGAKFLIYLAASIPIVVMLALVVAALGYLPYRLIRRFACDRCVRVWAWYATPDRLALTGVVLSVAMIQLVMRKCFFLSNLLLAERRPDPEWLWKIFMDKTGGLGSLYFCALLTGIAAAGGLLLGVRGKEPRTPFSRLVRALLALLVVLQFLLLPVNHGILIVNKEFPRVDSLRGQKKLAEGESAWLIWEGKEGVTYLVAHRKDGETERSLVTLPRKEVKETKIRGYDFVWDVLFEEEDREAPPQPKHEEKRQ